MSLLETIEGRLERLPARILLILALVAAIVISAAVGGIVAFLLNTPVCESRSFAFGIGLDRTHLAECGKDDGAKIASPSPTGRSGNRSPGGQTPSAPDAPVPEPKEHSPQSARPADLPEIVFAPDGQQQLRKQYGLTLVDAEEDTLSATPDGTYGFVYAGSFASVWDKKIGELTVRNDARDIYFEIQKRRGNRLFIIGYMRNDAARSLSAHEPGSETIKIYNSAYKATDAVIALPVDDIDSLDQTAINLPNHKTIPVLALGLRSH